MTDKDHLSHVITDFINRWQASGAAARANHQLFLAQWCEVLSVARLEPARHDDRHNAYVFERAVSFHNLDGTTSIGRIDLYKRGGFVSEAKQEGSQKQAAAQAHTDSIRLLLADAPQKRQKGIQRLIN